MGDTTPEGLEDVSRYPALVCPSPPSLAVPIYHGYILTDIQIAELYSRGWDKFELSGLTGGNLLRVFAGAEKVSRDLKAKGTLPIYDLYDKRPDLPSRRSSQL